MSTKQLQTPSLPHVLAYTLQTLGQILLLILVWSVFFLWSLLATQSLLAPWLVTLTGGTGATYEFFTACLGAYLPAFGLVMVSLTLFFYRIPRAQEKASVPLEFALTIILFIALHLFVIGLPWMGRCLPVSPTISFEQWLPSALLPVQTCLEPGIALTFTVLALLILFWFQGSVRLWQPIKQNITRITSLAGRIIR